MPLLKRLQDFRTNVTDAKNLIAAAHRVDGAGSPLWSVAETQTITQAAFLRIFLAWEGFLEGTFVDYIRGEPSIAGNILTRFANPIDELHAQKLLIGTQKYADYTNPDIVIRLAKLFLLDGEPYVTTINSVKTTLFNMKNIRNAAAHLTGTTNTALDSVASNLLGPPQNNVTVYDLITSLDPNSSHGYSVLDSLVLQIDTAAHAIANA